MNVVMKKKSNASKAEPAVMSSALQTPIELPDGMWARIAQKAYELWDARGRCEGNDLQDWFDAEQVVMDEIHEARE
jgi:hypothetical protein